MPEVPFLDLRWTYLALRQQLDAAYRRVMESGQYILGSEVDAFERAFADYCGVQECISVANGLEALWLLLLASGIGPGDEVIVPANTYIATWLSVSLVGATPVPVEPNEVSRNIDARRVSAAISPRVKGIVAVHLYGVPCGMDPLRELAEQHGLVLFEDASQAHGATLRGTRVGNLSDAAAFSFYPSKNLGAYGDGGAVTTNNRDLADTVRLLRNYGSQEKYVNEIVGFNSRLDPLQAAFLQARLGKLDEWNKRRSTIARSYLDGLDGIPDLSLPSYPDGTQPAWHLFVIRHPLRDRLRQKLGAQGIQTMIHYPIPPHLSGSYAAVGYRRGDYPISEAMAGTVLSLPIGPHLSDDSVEQVIQAVQAACRQL